MSSKIVPVMYCILLCWLFFYNFCCFFCFKYTQRWSKLHYIILATAVWNTKRSMLKWESFSFTKEYKFLISNKIYICYEKLILCKILEHTHTSSFNTKWQTWTRIKSNRNPESGFTSTKQVDISTLS